jgi:phosphoglycerate dehydrogenase-like enzyme
MFILTSAKIRRSIQKKLRDSYPDLSFGFCESMKDARKNLSEADILITYGEDLTEELIDEAKKLRWIMIIAAGIENMPMDAIKKRKITVTNARGIHKTPMAEYTIAMMLQTTKKMKQWYDNERAHHWGRQLKIGELRDKTVVIAGTGAIGSEIARLAKAFRMKTVGVNRNGGPAEHIDKLYTRENLNDCLRLADFVVSVLPSTDATDGFFAREQFQAMKDDAVFINIGRGNSVRENDLIEALQKGELAHAVLDVFEKEPLDESHPFWHMEQATVTPHFSGITRQYQHRAFELFEENLSVFLSGGDDYVNLIDYERGY